MTVTMQSAMSWPWKTEHQNSNCMSVSGHTAAWCQQEKSERPWFGSWHCDHYSRYKGTQALQRQKQAGAQWKLPTKHENINTYTYRKEKQNYFPCQFEKRKNLLLCVFWA